MSQPSVSHPAEVDAWIAALDPGLKPMVEALRRAVLVDPAVGERIKWNAPNFFFTGPLPPSDPKEYREVLVTFNVFQKNAVRLVFLRAAGLDDPTKLLAGTYADGRRLASFATVAEVTEKSAALAAVVRQLLRRMQE